MTRVRSAAGLALAIAAVATAPALSAQDTVAVTRHILALDLARLRPFEHAYDIYTITGDSTVHLGRRVVRFAPAILMDSSAGWLLHESRTGTVPASESLLLASDLRPVSYFAQLGPATLALEFANDSVRGSATLRTSRAGVALAVPPDLVPSGAMLDLLMTVLPLDGAFADSVAVLRADLESAATIAAEVAVIGEESSTDSTRGDSWLVALRAGSRLVHLSVDKASGTVRRLQQSVPAHVGTVVEYRLRDASVPPPE